MEGYDLFSDDLPSLGGSMLDGLAELGGAGPGADQSQYPTTNQGPGQSQGARAPAGHSYYGSSYPQTSGVPHRSLMLFPCYLDSEFMFPFLSLCFAAKSNFVRTEFWLMLQLLGFHFWPLHNFKFFKKEY